MASPNKPGKPGQPDKHWLDPPDWWRKWKPLRWLAVFGAIGVGISSYWGARVLLAPSEHPETARYLAVDKGLPFLAGFTSYQTIEQATALLSRAGRTWTTQAQHRPRSERYPVRDLDTITVADFEHLKTTGELQLEFFNNRLFEATFFPAEPAPYNVRLHQAVPLLKTDRNGKSELVTGSLRIASNVDHAQSDVGRAIRARGYVIWQDLRLMKQRQEWEAAYGSIAVVGSR